MTGPMITTNPHPDRATRGRPSPEVGEGKREIVL